jgi:hypothetical protein
MYPDPESYYIPTEPKSLLCLSGVEQLSYRKKEALAAFTTRASRRMDERAISAVS